MRKFRINGSFFLCLLLNMLFDLEWSIPAWILLALHFLLGWSIWWFWAALGLWLLKLLLQMAILRWLSRQSNTPDPPKQNKNPYSSGNTRK